MNTSNLYTASAVAALLALGACATPPQPPTQAIEAADAAIRDAERTRVPDYASPELAEARVKLAAAHDAVRDENMIVAQRLAEESRADAELASARTESAKAKTVNDDMQRSIDTLKQEMRRNTGAAR